MCDPVITLFNFISHRSAIVFLLTGLQLYFSTIVISRGLYHSGVELPIVSSPTIRKCFFSPSFSKKTLILSKPLSMLWFALTLISTKDEASLQINNSLFTCVFHSRLPLFPAWGWQGGRRVGWLGVGHEGWQGARQSLAPLRWLARVPCTTTPAL